jgi:Ras-related protein Rab-18/Ras-related protein Rab-32
MKIVLLGPPGCGKSTIFNYLCFDSKPQSDITVGCDYAKVNFIFSKRSYEVFLWDVSGNERDSPLMKVYLRDAMGVFLVCDILDKDSLNHLEKYREKVRLYCEDYNEKGIPIMIL